MPKWPISDDELREMYRTGAGNADARRWARFWGRIHASGVMPRRWVTLEVPGRRTGRPMSVPLGMADLDGRWYLVSMLGDCNWVRNVRANGGRATLVRGTRHDCRLIEIPPTQSALVLQRYVAKVPGGRPHIPVPRGAHVDEFALVVDRYPVFEVFRPAADGTLHPWAPLRSWAWAVPLLLAAWRIASRRRRPR